MTTGSNKKNEETTRPTRGFWGQPTNNVHSERADDLNETKVPDPAKIPEPEQQRQVPELNEPESESRTSMQRLPEVEPRDLELEEPAQEETPKEKRVPSWLRWRIEVSEIEPESDIDAETSYDPVDSEDTFVEVDDVDDTASLPRLDDYRRDYRSEDKDNLDATAARPALEWDDAESTESPSNVGFVPIVPSHAEEDAFGQEAPADDSRSAYGSASMGDRAKSQNKMRLRNALIALVVVLFFAGVYGFGVWYFSSHFLPRTSIGSFNASGKTVGAAKDGLEQETVDYACTLKVNDFSTTVHSGDIGLERDEESMAAEAMRLQSPFAWPIALIVPPAPKVDAKIKFDEGALKQNVSEAVDAYNEKALPSNDVSIAYDEETGLYSIEGTTSGTMVEADKLSQAAVSDVGEFKRECNPAPESCTREGTAQDIPSFAKAVRNVNAVRSTDIPILVNGEEMTYAYASNNVGFVSIGDGPSVVVDEDALSTWAEYTVADAVFFVDDWSYYYLDQEKFVEEFAKRLADGNVDGYEAPLKDELKTEGVSREAAYQNGGWDSSMGRYIDVDLDAQFARLFGDDGTVIWESAFVSGDTYEGHSTVTGVFSIYSMQTNAVLVGMDYNGDGQPDYESFVNYWMPFYGGYGLHDATWRAHFGGDYFAYDGSHGCVNLPYSKAEELYGLTYVGEQVYVHW